jgi:hypothetical protein
MAGFRDVMDARLPIGTPARHIAAAHTVDGHSTLVL